jgi:hypothetical protein
MSRSRAIDTRQALSDDILQKFCQLPTIKGHAADEAQLRGDLERVIADSWFLHTVINAIPWRRLIELLEQTHKAYRDFQTARRDLTEALSDPQAKFDLLAMRTDHFGKTLRKFQAARNRFAEVTSFLDKIEPNEQRERLITVWQRVLTDGFGKQSYILKRAASIASSQQTLTDPVKKATMERMQRDARFPERIGAVVFNLQSEEQCDRFLVERLAIIQSHPPPRSVGRPVDSKKHLECRLFVRDLLTAVATAGGDLTVNKDYKDKPGTLPAALQLLKPYLPSQITDKLSLGLLAEIRTNWRDDTGRKIDRFPE